MDYPDYDSDYRNQYINGSLEHPYGLPGMECTKCPTWSGIRVLPYECPESLRSHKNITEPWPIFRTKHEALQLELMRALSLQGTPFVTFRPGDDLQPCFLDVPSRPRADFLWPTLSMVVSERVKNVLVGSWPEDVIACPVILRKIGKREARLPPPVPSTGEPEDMIDEVPLVQDTSRIGPYFEIVVRKHSGYPPGLELLSRCPACGRETFNKRDWEPRMTREMWKGDHVFCLGPGEWVLITDPIRDALLALRVTNVIFKEMGSTD